MYKKFFIALLLFAGIASLSFATPQLTVSLSNPVSVSSTQIKWNVNIQNTSTSMEVVKISLAGIQMRTASGTITPAASSPISIVLDPYFSALSYSPIMGVTGGNTTFRLTGTPISTETASITVPTTMSLLGTITFNSLAPMTFPVNIGQTIGTPNTTISGYVGGTPTTFSVANTNLIQSNGATTNPVTFSAPLPIKIDNLDAFAKGKQNVISWSTSSEYNSNLQVVEASADGLSNWYTVAKVISKNSINGSKYQAFDNAPKLLTYYRIHSIDFDNSEDLSESVSVLRESVKTSRLRSVAPVPANGFIVADIELASDNDITYRVIDAIGKELVNMKVLGVVGDNTIRIDLSNIPSGTYTLLFTSEDLRASEQFIKH
jgi:hypothetical protein